MKRNPTDLLSVKEIVHHLFADVAAMIEQAKERVAMAVNAELTDLYWKIGTRIRHDILNKQRAPYGKRIVSSLGRQLKETYGSGYSEKNLRHMISVAAAFPDVQIVSALRRELDWTHLKTLSYIKDPVRREFYLELCRRERWSTRTLQERMQAMFYERTALSRKPEVLARKELEEVRSEGKLTPDVVFRDPYFLDFLGLKDTYSEKDLETAILRELERVLQELGSDFAFLDRQKRITIDGEDYYIDLLFYHRSMKRLVAIELKLGKFQAADKGQMELYLRWLDRYERREGEESPLGLILCAEKTAEHVELLQLEKSGIRVAQYLTQLPPKKLLLQRLRTAIQVAREQYAQRQIEGADGLDIPRTKVESKNK